MTETFKVVIVGSGPAGLSAAGHAAELGVSHVLLEATAAHANTVQRYQKGKFVMAEPGYLKLRSPLEFKAGRREEVLANWDAGIKKHRINLRHGVEVTGIKGVKGAFTLQLSKGEAINAEFVVLSIGVQGNPRRVEAPGGDAPFVQYTLDDPDAYQNENIVVIGAGDAAIENALALSRHNKVFLVNRQAQFARAKEGNLNAVLKAISDGVIQCFYGSAAARVEVTPPGAKHAGVLVLKTETGEAAIPCDRIIARLGAVPPRKFVESCGAKFPSADANALPELTESYESSVPGIYIIGALGGYPLIKQAMNQGYEVVEYLLGRACKPADDEELQLRLEKLPYSLSVENSLKLFRDRIPMFGELNPLLFRELVLESKVLVVAKGDAIYRTGEYSNFFYTVVDGEVSIGADDGQASAAYRIGAGEFFGELSLLSGRRRTDSARALEESIVIETPGRVMFKLMSSVPSIRQGLDQVFIQRFLHERIVPNVPPKELRAVAKAARLANHAAGATLFKEGDEGQSVYLLRKGAVLITRTIDGKDVSLGVIKAGQYLGEVALLGVKQRANTARAVVATETVELAREAFLDMVGRDKNTITRIQTDLQARVNRDVEMQVSPSKGALVNFLMKQGIGEATNVLLIDETLCVGCDNCEKACAATHGNVARMNRAAGPTFAAIHVPTACRHCESPHCMKDCPPNAISREPAGEVFINYDTCIGCGNCERNCPYGVIKLATVEPRQTSLWWWLLTGAGVAPGVPSALGKKKTDKIKKAVKCDLCKDLAGGPACVRACPTGAARRVGPEQLTELETR